jgi:hypoxanthine phosphoribosyltransferase
MKNIGNISIQLLAALVIILLLALEIILGEHTQLVEFVVIAVTCGIVILFVGLYLAENRREVNKIYNKLDVMCSEFLDGDEQRMSWARFWATTKNLQDLIQADISFKPDIILSVGRSGAIVGSMLAGNMEGLPHIGIDRRNFWSKEISESKPLKKVTIFPPPRILSKELQGKNILCVMSECDTGRTFEALIPELRKIEGIGKVKTATLYRYFLTYYVPDYVAVEDNGKRPDFPFRTSTWRGDNKSPH